MKRKYIGVAALVASCLLLVTMAGAVVGDDHGEHDVDVEVPEEALDGDNTTIEVTVENDEDVALIFPLVEVPLDGGLTVADELRSDREDGTEAVDNVTADHDGQTEERLAFINDSTFAGDTDALFIEGEEVPANDEVTYRFDLFVDTTQDEVEIEVDVRSLNEEENNVRTSETTDVRSTGTVVGEFDSDSGELAIRDDGEEVEAVEDGDSIEATLPDQESYEVAGEVPLLNDEVVMDVTPPEFSTASVDFFPVEQAAEPEVIATTASSAAAIGEDRSLTPGTAEESTTQTVEFDLQVDGSDTQLAVEEAAGTPLRGIDETGDFEEADWHSNESVATMTYDGDTDGTELVSLSLEGYPLGDVTTSGDVTNEDATEIATMIAEGNADEINEYGDVTDDGDVSVADAMKIQQYHEDNRDADYGGE